MPSGGIWLRSWPEPAGIGDVHSTRRTFNATDSGRDLVVCESADDMFDQLGI